jgi:predicted acetyltransferase
MSLSLKWCGKDAADVVGRARALCYAPVVKEVADYKQRLSTDGRITADDLLIAQRDGVAIGTATSYSMTMWLRGAPVPCQGVAYVGTVKTHRRSGGVASAIMRETLRKARDRGQIVSALMPFRASFYEHFGYGLVERRTTWTIPLSTLPKDRVDTFTFVTGPTDARRACRDRMVRAGHGEIERLDGAWHHWANQEDEAYVVADQPGGPDAPARSWWVWTQQKQPDGKDVLTVYDQAYDSPESLRRALAFFGTLRDQYSAVTLTLPADLPLNRLLTETQVPHRPVNHETAKAHTFTRMQVRVLDHARLLAALHLPDDARGAATVAIAETEGTTTTLRLEIEAGRATATPTTAPPDFECADRDWAAIVLGDLPATRAVEHGLARATNPAAPRLLDTFSRGPAPFCHEYF